MLGIKGERMGRGISYISLFSLILIFIWMPQFAYGQREHGYAGSKIVPLSEILEQPRLWKGVPVHIPLRFCMMGNIYVPFRTRYEEDSFINFSAWDTQTHIWTPQGFRTPHPYFYVEKDHKEMKKFLNLKTFDTILALVKVESVFNNRPFIRVVWICKKKGDLNVHNLRKINRGMRKFKARNFDEAIKIFNTVFLTNPPDDIAAMLHKTIAKIYAYEQNDFAKAIVELQKVLTFAPKDAEARGLLYRCRFHLKHKDSFIKPIPVKENSKNEEEAPKEEKAVKEEKKEPTEKIPGEDVPKKEVPKEDVPKEDVPKEDVPIEEVPKEEVPKEDVPKEKVPKEEVPKEEVPKNEEPIEEEPLEKPKKEEKPLEEPKDKPLEEPKEVTPKEKDPLEEPEDEFKEDDSLDDLEEPGDN